MYIRRLGLCYMYIMCDIKYRGGSLCYSCNIVLFGFEPSDDTSLPFNEVVWRSLQSLFRRNMTNTVDDDNGIGRLFLVALFMVMKAMNKGTQNSLILKQSRWRIIHYRLLNFVKSYSEVFRKPCGRQKYIVTYLSCFNKVISTCNYLYLHLCHVRRWLSVSVYRDTTNDKLTVHLCTK